MLNMLVIFLFAKNFGGFLYANNVGDFFICETFFFFFYMLNILSMFSYVIFMCDLFCSQKIKKI